MGEASAEWIALRRIWRVFDQLRAPLINCSREHIMKTVKLVTMITPVSSGSLDGARSVKVRSWPHVKATGLHGSLVLDAAEFDRGIYKNHSVSESNFQLSFLIIRITERPAATARSLHNWKLSLADAR